MEKPRAVIVFLALPMVLAVVLGLACGPSIRRTYQSDNAFERCFDMDYRPLSAMEDKKECWSTWLEKHVYNQPPDKIAYARLRLVELEEGVSVPGPPGPPGSFDRRPELDPDAGTEGPSQGAPREEVLASTEESSRCVENCNAVLATCDAACGADAGIDDTCRNACKKSFEQCLKLCDEP